MLRSVKHWKLKNFFVPNPGWLSSMKTEKPSTVKFFTEKNKKIYSASILNLHLKKLKKFFEGTCFLIMYYSKKYLKKY